MHGLIFETSVCYWQDQPDFCSWGFARARALGPARARTKSTLGRPGYGRVAFLSLCNLPGTQTARLGLVVRVTPPAAPQASTQNGVATRVSRHAQPLPASPRGANGGPVSSGPLWSFPQAAQRYKGGADQVCRPSPEPPSGRKVARTHGHAAQQTPRKGSCSTRALTLAQAFATWVMLQHCCPSGSSTNAFKPRLRRAGGFPRRTLLHTGNSHTLNTLGARTSLGQRRNVVGACHRSSKHFPTPTPPAAGSTPGYCQAPDAGWPTFGHSPVHLTTWRTRCAQKTHSCFSAQVARPGGAANWKSGHN